MCARFATALVPLCRPQVVQRCHAAIGLQYGNRVQLHLAFDRREAVCRLPRSDWWISLCFSLDVEIYRGGPSGVAARSSINATCTICVFIVELDSWLNFRLPFETPKSGLLVDRLATAVLGNDSRFPSDTHFTAPVACRHKLKPPEHMIFSPLM